VPEGGTRDTDKIFDLFLSWTVDQGFELYPAQEEALLEIMAGRNVILNTPTGSGKSLVALGMHFKALCEGKTCFYTSPIKALASEKFFDLCDLLGAENVGMQTGDASINPDASIVCCTAEVLMNRALRQGTEAGADYVVMDEFHYYGDPDRGVAWQVPLLVLQNSRFLLMSATLGNTAPIAERLTERTGVDTPRRSRKCLWRTRFRSRPCAPLLPCCAAAGVVGGRARRPIPRSHRYPSPRR
jgi:superfamily II RNA helicase